MKRNFHKNTILVGHIDWFCLACACAGAGEAEALSHLQEPDHAKNLVTAQLVDKYKEDNILKVKQRYYCVYCNAVFRTATKVTLHIADVAHKDNKGAFLLRREGGAIVFRDLLLDGCAWHGIVGDMCAVCNVEFEDEAEHKDESIHLFNLAKSNVGFGVKDIYRKIDATTFQCITCNTVLPLQDLNAHFEELEHKNVLLKCAKAYLDFQKEQELLTTKNISKGNKTSSNCINEDSSDSSSEGFKSAECSSDESYSAFINKKYTKEENKMKILESVTFFEKSEVNINFESETAFCKKCLGNVIFDFKAIEEHIDEHKRHPKNRDVGYVPFQCEVDMKVNNQDRQPPNDCKTPTSAIEFPTKPTRPDVNQNVSDNAQDLESTPPNVQSPSHFAADNEITYNKGNNDAYCRVCGTRLPAHLKSMEEHVAGYRHKKKMNKQEMFKSSTATFTTRSGGKITTKDFVKTLYHIVQMNIIEETVVNMKFCMPTLSFHLITKLGERLRCQACEESFMRFEAEYHRKLFTHRMARDKIYVITKYESEFVREVRPGLFHCGFCSMLEAGETSLDDHLRSEEHRIQRALMAANLAFHLPNIREYQHEQAQEMFWQRMFGRMPFF